METIRIGRYEVCAHHENHSLFQFVPSTPIDPVKPSTCGSCGGFGIVLSYSHHDSQVDSSLTCSSCGGTGTVWRDSHGRP